MRPCGLRRMRVTEFPVRGPRAPRFHRVSDFGVIHRFRGGGWLRRHGRSARQAECMAVTAVRWLCIMVLS